MKAKRLRCPWKPPLDFQTHSYKEFLVEGTKDILLRGEAVVKIVDAEHRIIAETESIITAMEIVKTLNEKYPSNPKKQKP